MNATETSLSGLWGSIGIAFVLWFIMFVLHPFNFWLMMSFSTTLLSVISFILTKPLFEKTDFSGRNVALGVGSAAILYGIFFLGNELLIAFQDIFPELLGQRADNIQSVYSNRGDVPRFLVAVLLFFPIGFGEEVFWRGLIQKGFSIQFSPLRGLVLTTAIYTAVHIPTLNPVLILAAFTCGLFWGFLYMKTESLVLVTLSHMLWDPFIFVIRPIY